MEISAEKLAKICNEVFCSEKRNCGIIVKGGNPKLRGDVVFILGNMVEVPVYTPEFNAPEGQYVFNLDDYIR